MPRDLPLCVERFDDHHSPSRLACPECDHEREADSEEIGLTEGLPRCPVCQAGWLTWKYEEGERCENCGKLDFSMPLPPRVGGERQPGIVACSRACQLQAEYARSLREAA